MGKHELQALSPSERTMLDKETHTTIGTAVSIMACIVVCSCGATWWISTILHGLTSELAGLKATINSNVMNVRRDIEVFSGYLAERNPNLSVPSFRDVSEGSNPRDIKRQKE